MEMPMTLMETLMAVAIVGTVFAGAATVAATVSPHASLSRWDPEFAGAVAGMETAMTRPCLGREDVERCHRVYGYEFENFGKGAFSVGSVQSTSGSVMPVVEIENGHVVDALGDRHAVGLAKRDLYTWLLHDEMEAARRRMLRHLVRHAAY
jgi:hypothetical protein